jgi:hypothetical protein
MILSFASSLLGREVSESWVSRFLLMNSSNLTLRWQSGMDYERHQADSGPKYSLYFKLLDNKMKKYNTEPSHIFNMDEKGFMLGVTRKQTCQESGWPYGRLDGRRLGSFKPASQIVYKIGNQPACQGLEA